jgi:hypothetical protein
MDEIADFGDWASLSDSHPNVRFPNVEDSDAWLETLTTQQIRFWLTSIHNYTIYEAWSKVVQRLMEDIYGTIEGLLNTFGQVSSLPCLPFGPCCRRNASLNPNVGPCVAIVDA